MGHHGQKIQPVILAGGTGSRLWPVSRELYPKQFQKLGGDLSLLQQTATRVEKFLPPVIVCHQQHRFIVQSQMDEIGIGAAKIILEPESRGTLPAITIASFWSNAHDPEAAVLVLPADHQIANEGAFLHTVTSASQRVKEDTIILFGVSATSIQTGFGHIQPIVTDESLLAQGCEVEAFIEKPELETAENMLASGSLWNSGVFLFCTEFFITELRDLSPEHAAPLLDAFDHAHNEGDFLVLPTEPFLSVSHQMFDTIILERSKALLVFMLDCGWQELRSWLSVYDAASDSDESGNVKFGDVFVKDCKSSFIQSDSLMVAAIGIEDTTIVATEDAVLVSDRKRPDNIYGLIANIEKSGSKTHISHQKLYQQWGVVHQRAADDNFTVNELIVKPGVNIPQTTDGSRANHFVVVEGTAALQYEDKEILLREDQSAFVRRAVAYMISNPGILPLRIVQIQSGPNPEPKESYQQTN